MKETKFKQTEVGMIPSDWGVAKLGNFVKKIDAGVSVNSDESIYSDNYVLKTSAIHNGVINYKEVKAVIKKDIHRLKCPLKEDCLIVSRMNTPDLVGECAYSEKDVDNIFLPDRLWLVPNEFKNKISFKLINYVLNTPLMRNAIKGTATGTSNSMKNISKGKFLSIECAFPPTIEEQQRIANALSDVDTLIANLEKLIAKKKNIKQGAMQQLLTGKKRLPGFAPAKPTYKQTELGRIPADWEVKALNELCECNRSSTLSLPKEFVYVDLESVYQGKLLKKQIIKACDAPSRAQRFFEKGDILYQTVRPYQRNNLKVDFDAKNYIASTGYAVLHCKESLLNSDYLYQYIHTDRFVDVVMDNCSGTSYPAINPKTLMTFNIIIPSSFEEQTAIANVLSDMNTEIATLETKLAKYRKLKTGMMQQLLTGKIRLV